MQQALLYHAAVYKSEHPGARLKNPVFFNAMSCAFEPREGGHGGRGDFQPRDDFRGGGRDDFRGGGGGGGTYVAYGNATSTFNNASPIIIAGGGGGGGHNGGTIINGNSGNSGSNGGNATYSNCLLYTYPSPRD